MFTKLYAYRPYENSIKPKSMGKKTSAETSAISTSVAPSSLVLTSHSTAALIRVNSTPPVEHIPGV
jgi:hypothetical protein